MKTLLRDTLTFNISPSQIAEAKSLNGGKLVVEGVIQRANAKNQNGRIYPRNILEREVKTYKGFIAEKMALGELDHPDSTVVNLKNVSHNIMDVWWQGDDLYGKFEILSTPSGNILQSLFESGVKLGVSSRGLGSTKTIDESTVEVQDDFSLVCWDFVSTPSTDGAFVNLAEGLNRNVEPNDTTYVRVDEIIHDLLGEITSLTEG